MKKKGILIAIIVLIVLLVLAGGAFAYIYFATDLLKSDKQLFAKYAIQMGDREEGFFPTSLEEYFNKKDTTAYENNGSISANTTITADISSDETLQTVSSAIDKANATNISFFGRVDSANRKAEQNIALNYSDTANFTFNYKQDGDIYGLQTDTISPNYIAIENNNLQEFSNKMGTMNIISNVPNKIEIPQVSSLAFTDEEIAHVAEQYIMPVYEGLADEKFTSAENPDGSVSYTLSITNIELRNIEVQMLETLKNDTMMLNKFNTILQEVYDIYGMFNNTSSQETDVESQINTDGTTVTINAIEITAEDIDKLIAELNEEDLKEVMVPITITQNNGVTNRVSVTQDTRTFTLGKEQSEGNISYDAILTGKNDEEGNASRETIQLNMSYSGLNTNSVTEDVSMDLNSEGRYNTTYSFVNTLTFGNVVNIEGFGQDTAILNNYNAEQITPFLTQVTLIIAQSNSELMSQIGFPAEMINPVVTWVTSPSILMNVLATSAIETVQSGSSSAAVETFNSAFTNYEGEQRGANVKTLCDTVRNSNLTANSGEKVNIKIGEATATTATDNVNDPVAIKDQIDATKTYNVTFSYDASTGKICEIGVTEAGDLNSQAEQGQQTFNEAMMYEDQHTLNVEYWVNEQVERIQSSDSYNHTY